MHDYLLWILVVVLFSLIGAGIAKLLKERFAKRERYGILTALFLTILIISELMKEGFAALGSWAAVSLVAGLVGWFLIRRFYKNESILYHEFPKMLGLASSYALATDLGQAIAILFSAHYLPQGALFYLKHPLKILFEEQFKFVILGIIAFTILSSLEKLINAHIMTITAGMMLFIVIEEGFLKKNK